MPPARLEPLVVLDHGPSMVVRLVATGPAWLAEPAPDPVKDRGERNGTLFAAVFGQHHNHVHLLLCWEKGSSLHLLEQFEQGW